MVGTNSLETSSLNELFHQVWAGTHVCHTPNNQKPSLILTQQYNITHPTYLIYNLRKLKSE